MKLLTSLLLGAGLLAAASIAGATSGQLAQVSVHQDRFSPTDCAPPNAAQACAEFHAAIRRNFSMHEIGMLFGAATAYPEYPTSYQRVRVKYAAFVRDVDENGLAVAVATR